MLRGSTSTSSGQRSSLTDGDVYVFTLQTAYLAHLVEQEAAGSSGPPPGAGGVVSTAPSSPALGADASRRSFDRTGLADRLRDLRLPSSAREARFPEKFVKRLTERIDKIAAGREVPYSTTPFCATAEAFLAVLRDESTQKRFKEHRSIEEVLLQFYAVAQASLQQRMPSEAERRAELDTELDQFIRLVSETLRALPTASRDVLDRLGEYEQRFLQHRRSSTPCRDGLAAAAAAPLVSTTAALWGVDATQLRLDLQSIRTTCTLPAGVIDLKRCIYRIHTQTAYADDFLTPDAYRQWRSNELAQLSQLVAELCHARPDLLSAANTSDSLTRRRASLEVGRPLADGALPAEPLGDGDDLTYIPPDAPAAYQRLFALCLERDLEGIRAKAADEEVSLSILSHPHVDLLGTCAHWWRVSAPFCALAHLRLFKSKYDLGEIPLECLVNAMDALERVLTTHALSQWRHTDRKMLIRLLDGLLDTLLRVVLATVQETEAPLAPECAAAAAMADRAQAIVTEAYTLTGAAPPPSRAGALEAALAAAATQRYTARAAALLASPTSPLGALTELGAWLERLLRTLDTLCPMAVLGRPPAQAVAARLVPVYLHDVGSVREAVWEQVQTRRDLAMLNSAWELLAQIRALLAWPAVSVPSTFDLKAWFRPYVPLWLSLSEERTAAWVQRAVRNDTFVPVDGADTQHSTSVDDLFDALAQQVRALQALEWPDAYDLATFFSQLARSMRRLVELYCEELEALYMAEMTPPPPPLPSPALAFANEALASLPPKQAAWVAKAKLTIQREKRVTPFLLQPYSCVKLNNMERARRQLDELYRAMNADEQAAKVQAHTPASPAAEAPRIFSVKVVQAELRASTASDRAMRLDTFVTLSDAQGTRLAQTRTLLDTMTPRWDEAVDVPVSAPRWLSASVWQRPANEAPVLYGRAALCLDARDFAEHATQDVWLELDRAGGRLLLRMNMSDGQEGILYDFGHAFRVVKRSEVDMVRVLVDHMSLFMRQFLSRSVLRSLVRGARVERVVGNVRALYTSALAQASGSAPSIPRVESGGRRSTALSDPEMEAAIVPLLDYFEDTLGTLQSSLCEPESQFVLTRVWKEVLVTLEGLLVPPLSDAPSDMPPLSDAEVDVVFKWLSFLRNFFHAYDATTGVVHGVPLHVLQGPKYRELLSYLLLHDQSTDALMIECVRGFQAHLASAGRGGAARTRAKSVLDQRSLGTIRQHQRSKAAAAADGDDTALLTDMAMRILRMRPDTGDFLAQQLTSMHSLPTPQGAALHASPTQRRIARRRRAQPTDTLP
ncbi:hypothetical protein MNAN1_000339 [Malassezia nana]|uniref:Uncharacterized protein n=1 Tax=Malassezia nana TaxID=180528 RepID=A0AAF0J298_9BASI|nr:hypothetical protein MNAN1_000339 [Malassezia nana]